MSLAISRMSFDDLRLVLSWANAEGWNPGVADAEPFYAADNTGFFIGREAGEAIAAISAVTYGPAYGFVGLYICRPEFRGQGHGIAMWRAAMGSLGSRVAGLDGVPAQVGNYARSGFVAAYGSTRYSAQLRLAAPADGRLRPIDDSLLPALHRFDAPFFPGPRESFLRVWTRSGDGREGIAIVSDGAVAGYGVIRDSASGHRIGPLFASSEADADILFRALCALRPGGTVYLDMPDPSGPARALAARYGLQPAFETTRMYRGPAPSLPLERIYAITSLELG